MKYIKTFEKKTNLEKDIEFLVNAMSYPSIDYANEIVNYYKLTKEQIHNLRLAVEYGYLYYEDYRNIVNEVINSKREYPDRVWYDRNSERKFKNAYETNFKTKIEYINEPYPIACNKKWGIKYINSLDSFDLYDVIGKIPTNFGTKYLVGKGRYRGDSGKTLWEEFRNTNRESEFIKVYDQSELYFLTDKDIEHLELKEKADKYNL